MDFVDLSFRALGLIFCRLGVSCLKSGFCRIESEFCKFELSRSKSSPFGKVLKSLKSDFYIFEFSWQKFELYIFEFSRGKSTKNAA